MRGKSVHGSGKEQLRAVFLFPRTSGTMAGIDYPPYSNLVFMTVDFLDYVQKSGDTLVTRSSATETPSVEFTVETADASSVPTQAAETPSSDNSADSSDAIPPSISALHTDSWHRAKRVLIEDIGKGSNPCKFEEQSSPFYSSRERYHEFDDTKAKITWHDHNRYITKILINSFLEAKVPYHERHNTLVDLAIRYEHLFYHDVDSLFFLLKLVYDYRCAQEPAMPDDEIRNIAAWAVSKVTKEDVQQQREDYVKLGSIDQNIANRGFNKSTGEKRKNVRPEVYAKTDQRRAEVAERMESRVQNLVFEYHVAYQSHQKRAFHKIKQKIPMFASATRSSIPIQREYTPYEFDCACRDGKFAQEVQFFRELRVTNPKEAATYKAANLPAVGYSYIADNRPRSGVHRYNGFFAFDFDPTPANEALSDEQRESVIDEIKKWVITLPYVVSVMKSASGRGLVVRAAVDINLTKKVDGNTVPLCTDEDRDNALHCAAMNMYEQELKRYVNHEYFKFDVKTTHRTNGIRFVTYDSKAVIREAYFPLVLKSKEYDIKRKNKWAMLHGYIQKEAAEKARKGKKDHHDINVVLAVTASINANVITNITPTDLAKRYPNAITTDITSSAVGGEGAEGGMGNGKIKLDLSFFHTSTPEEDGTPCKKQRQKTKYVRKRWG